MKESEHSFYDLLKKHKHQLIIPSKIGQAKECFRHLPSPDHRYGYKKKVANESAGSLITSWQIHQPTKELSFNQDYSKLNKLGVVNKITKPKQVKEFREKHKIIFKKSRDKAGNFIKSPDENFVYGMKNKPSTPIRELIQYDYANKADLDRHNLYLEESQSRIRKNKSRS